MHMHIETQCWYGFHIGHFDRNEISFRVIEYHVNTTQNVLPTHVHQNIGSSKYHTWVLKDLVGLKMTFWSFCYFFYKNTLTAIRRHFFFSTQ